MAEIIICNIILALLVVLLMAIAFVAIALAAITFGGAAGGITLTIIIIFSVNTYKDLDSGNHLNQNMCELKKVLEK